MYGAFDQLLPEKEIQDLVGVVKDFVLSHGIIVRNKENPDVSDSIQHAPITLFPSPIPRRCFQQAQSVQKDFNLLMHRISHDYQFLSDCLQNVIKVDDFTRHIWDIYETVVKEGIAQPVCLAMIRSDYMIDCQPTDTNNMQQFTDLEVMTNDANLKQVEINTMAASFAGLSQRLQSYHKYILNHTGCSEEVQRIPDNGAADCLVEGLLTAWKHYGNDSAMILFLVHSMERNIYDQKWLEYSIAKKNSKVKVIRRTLKQLQVAAQLSEDKKLVIVKFEVAVVYQRSCYTPSDFDSEDAWKCRLMIERSKAIVCPNAGYHLAGTKKVQQVLAQPGVVERFIQDPEAVQRIRSTFVRQFSLDLGEDGDRAIDMAIADPHSYVLKPQREGGGNNIYGEDVREFLLKIRDTDERLSYIMMERIQPTIVFNYPVVQSTAVPCLLTSMVSELGIFGILVGTEDEIYVNKQQGYLLRTKKLGTDEGGVATGYSVLDTPFLID